MMGLRPILSDKVPKTKKNGVPMSSAPATHYEYSNFGYALLGRIIANVSGMPYRRYVEQSLLTPLGMASSGYQVSEWPVARRSLGYRWEDGRWKREPDMADGAFGLTQELERETAGVWAKVKDHVTPLEWPEQARLISAINRLKRERDAVILAHNYMTPEIFHGVGDYVGDSLGLAKEAARSDAKVIVQAGVHFMAETSKILSPEKTVLIPDLRAGCSLASSITGADVRLIKQRYPGLPVITYVNTTAEVKAETDICCTSANAVDVVNSFDSDTVLCIPDEYLAMNVANQTTKKILTWKGVDELFDLVGIVTTGVSFFGEGIANGISSFSSS